MLFRSAQGVLKDFSPAVDLSPEGLIYAGIGFLLGLLLLGLLQQGAMLLGLGFAGGRGRADA